MNKPLLAMFCFAAGAAVGFTAGYYISNKEQQEKEKEFVEPIPVEKKEETKPEINQKGIFNGIVSDGPARLAKPGVPGINYSAYVKDLQYKAETQAPSDDDPDDESDISEEDEINIEDYMETYEERVEREHNEYLQHAEEYKREHKGKIELMREDEWDTDFPETDYEHEDLYYFTESEMLTDEDGHQLDEVETIGKKVRQVGWMQSQDEVIYVRNHVHEKEYRIFKEHCEVTDWF